MTSMEEMVSKAVRALKTEQNKVLRAIKSKSIKTIRKMYVGDNVMVLDFKSMSDVTIVKSLIAEKHSKRCTFRIVNTDKCRIQLTF